MREYPWHLRLPTLEHFQWFEHLVQLHELTLAWIKEGLSEKPPTSFLKQLSEEESEDLWMLDLVDSEFEKLLDDTSPTDTLIRLENAVWIFQSTALSHLYSRVLPTQKASLDQTLEQTSWKFGKNRAETRWKKLASSGALDLRGVLLALNDSPFSGYPRGQGFLVRRALTNEVLIELRTCPHQITNEAVKSVEDRLCRLHAHWMRGFACSLNDRVGLQHLVQNPRCTQRWYFP